MALIDRQVRDRITSRGLGRLKGPETGVVTINKSVKGDVKIDKLYHPTTGTFSKEEEISGWKWDRTLPQAMTNYSEINEITSNIGGYNYNLTDGLKPEDYRGSVLFGCELVDVVELENKWMPVFKTGSYNLQGINRKLYSNNSICKIFENETVDVSSYKELFNTENPLVCIYKRDNNFTKNIYREYKEENSIFKYSVENDVLIITEERMFKIGNEFTELSRTQNSWEALGLASSDQNKKSFYTKYFPCTNVQARKKIGEISFEEIDPDLFVVDRELGIITFDDTIAGEVYVSYSAIPRVELELKKSEYYIERNIDLKSHAWSQNNILLEISTEDKNVNKLILSSDLRIGQFLNYGSDYTSLTCQALNAAGSPVDEIDITFECLDDKQEVLFEGNLLQIVKQSNNLGEAKTLLSAPLRESVSSYTFRKDLKGVFQIPEREINNSEDVQNKTVIFEILKVDQISSSNGLSLTGTYEASTKSFIVKQNLQNSDYKIFRNIFDNIIKTNEPCFNTFYNTGVVKYKNLFPFKVIKRPILKITEEKIYIKNENNFYFTDGESYEISLFKKNERDKDDYTQGLERVLYYYDQGTNSYLKVRPSSVSNGILTYVDIVNRLDDDLVVGYKIFVPRKTIVRAKCLDPATGRYIYSNEVVINVELGDIYKSELIMDGSAALGEASALDIANYLSYDPVDNSSIFFEA